MYLEHFSFSRFPFDETLPADRMFRSRDARETDTRLQHLLELRGIGLLTGEPGCGKTSACRRFADRLRSDSLPPAYVALTTGSVLDAYQSIGWQLGLDVSRYRAQAFRAIRAEVSRRASERGQSSVLIIDVVFRFIWQGVFRIKWQAGSGIFRIACVWLGARASSKTATARRKRKGSGGA